MPYGRITLLLLIGASTAAAASRAADAPPARSDTAVSDALPTRTEMRESFDAGDYPRTLQQVARALAVKGDAARDYDRYELLILKAEAHLRLKNTAAAAAAFDEAAKSATHAKGAALGTVSAELVRRSRNLQYTPPAPKKEKSAAAAPAEPIDITDADGRARAFTAMLEDAKAKVGAEVKAARAATTLPPVVDALAMLRDLRLLELAAEDESGAASEMAAGLAERARALAEHPVQQMADRVAKIEEVASREYTDYTPRRNTGGAGRVTRVTSGVTGPTAAQSAELRRIVADCRGIHESIARIAVVLLRRADGRPGEKGGDEQDAGVLGGAVLDELAAVAKDADRVRSRANELLRLTYAPAAGYDVYEEDERAFREQYGRPGTNVIRRPVRPGRPGSTGTR